MSPTGVFVSHPISSFVENRSTLSDFDDSLDAGNIRIILRTSEEGVLRVDRLDERSGLDSWVFFAAIPSTDWLIGLVLDKDEVLRSSLNTGQLRWQLAGAALAAIAALAFLSIPLFGAQRGTTRGLWAVSITFSLLLLAGISYLWFLNTTRLATENERNVLLVDRAASAKVVADNTRGTVDPILVPTGLFVQSLAFVGANSVLMNGIIWQKIFEEYI